MKKLALLSLISMPAFAHEVKFNRSEYLKLSGNDPVKAQELYFFCGDRSGEAKCIKDLAGAGNLRQEAVQLCVRKDEAARPNWKLPGTSSNEPAGARSHQADGTDWHSDYQRDPQGGRLHRHEYAQIDRDEAYRSKLTDELVKARSRIDAMTTHTETKSFGSESSLNRGIAEIMGYSETMGTSKLTEIATKIALPEKDILDAIASAEAARRNPDRVGIKPSITCYKEERDCRGGEKNHTNSSYDPNAEKDRKDKEEKKDDKKTSNNPPKHEDNGVKDIPDSVSTSGGDMMAGESDLDVTGIATPVAGDLSALTPLQKCVEKETKLLNDELGKKSFDPNASADDHVENERAKSLLQHGYCDKQIMGREFCKAKKFKEDSVIAIEIQEDRKEAAASALDSFKKSGICDPNALGRDFCKAQKFKWETTPTGSKEINFDNDGRRPSKTGEIPRD